MGILIKCFKSKDKDKKHIDKLTIDILKNLTPDDCIRLAEYLYPNLVWTYIASSDGWDGHDIVAGNENDFNGYPYLLQIDYRTDVNSEQARIRYYENGEIIFTPDMIKLYGFFKNKFE